MENKSGRFSLQRVLFVTNGISSAVSGRFLHNLAMRRISRPQSFARHGGLLPPTKPPGSRHGIHRPQPGKSHHHGWMTNLKHQMCEGIAPSWNDGICLLWLHAKILHPENKNSHAGDRMGFHTYNMMRCLSQKKLEKNMCLKNF